MKIFCDKCGVCCTMLHAIELPLELLDELDDGTGRCRYLKSNNECSIYENRPDICNSEWMYEHIYKEEYTREAYVDMMYLQCLELKKLKKGTGR